MAEATTQDDGTFDPVALAAMFDEFESGKGAEEPKDEPVAEPAADVKTEEKTEAAAAPSAEPDGVATKDGKHIIPYSVLKADRDRATRAEQALHEANEKLATLQAAALAGTPGVKSEPAATAQPDVSDMSADELAAYKEDFPAQYKMMMALQAKVDQLQTQLKPVQKSVQDAEASREQTYAEERQDAIDATPKLAYIVSSDPVAFELAKGFDNMLKASPAWEGRTLAERFAKVVELVENANGTITIPGQVVTPQPAQKTAEQLKTEAKALAAAAAAASKTAVPSSLSDFPAGQHFANDEQAAIESMSAHQLAAKFSSMSPSKLEAYLDNL